MSSPGSRAVGSPPDPGLLSPYDRALPEVYGYLLARCGQRALAEDLTAETFLAAVRAESDGGGPTTVPEQLSPGHRAALTLRYLDDLAVAQVAAHLGRTVHATEALLVRARTAFRRRYESTEQPGGAP